MTPDQIAEMWRERAATLRRAHSGNQGANSGWYLAKADQLDNCASELLAKLGKSI